MTQIEGTLGFRRTRRAAWAALAGLAVGVWCTVASAQSAEPPASRRLLVGINYDYPPYEFVDQAGEARGYDVDLARAVLSRMGFEADFRPDAWSEVRKALASGRIDLAAGMLYSRDRDREFDFSVPHTVVHYSIFVRRTDTDIHTEADLLGRKVIVERGSMMDDYMRKRGFGAELVLVDSEPAALRLLATGAHDSALAPNVYAQTAAFQGEFANLRTVGPPLSSRELAFAVREGNTELQATLNEGLGLIKASGDYKTIQDRWFGVIEPTPPSWTNILRYVAIPVIPLLLLAAASITWTWTLRRRVAQQTQKLRVELTEREKAEAAIAYRLKRERVIALMSAKLVNMSASQVDVTIDLVLADLCDHLGADMASFFELSEGGTLLSARYSWTRPASPTAIPAFLPKPLEAYPWLAREARAQRTVYIAEVAQMDDAAPVEKAQWTREGLTSLLVVPISLRDELMGLLAVGTKGTQRGWDDDDQQLLRTFGGSFLQALARARAERATHTERDRLAVTLASIGEGVIGCDGAGKIVLLNNAAVGMLQRANGECEGAVAEEVVELRDERTRSQVSLQVEALVKGERPPREGRELRLVGREGRELLVSYGESIVRDQEGQARGAVLVLRDITAERARLLQMQQTQKLESMGLLAGGIAHDFNNILTAILGNVSLAREFVSEADPAAELLSEAERASVRAQGLTQQLLTFAKGGAPVRRVVHLGAPIREAAVFALRGSNVRCDVSIDDPLRLTFADAGQIGQVVQNLAINAKQAMPAGGTLTVQARNTTLDERAGLPLSAGDYVVVTVTDTGAGIAPDDLPRIFDPYFTTKVEGSGLGLTTSYSIVKNHGGHMEVESVLGKGTTFRFYVPAASPEAGVDAADDTRITLGTGRILVMDDDEAVLRVVAQMLRRAGYDPVCVGDGRAAVDAYQTARAEGHPFRAVITDLTVPGGMGGKECVAALRELDPAVRAIVASGYSHDPVMADHQRHGFVGVVAKPFELSRLTAVLGAVLAAGTDS